MPYYRWDGVGEFRDSRNNRTVEPGEVVELSEGVVGSHDFVEVDEPPGEKEDVTCAYGDCSRSVDDVGEYCWQHPPEDE